MGDARADDWQAERHVDRAVHAEQLERDVPLIVVHGHHRVERAVAGFDHQRVGGERPGRVEPLRACLRNGRLDQPRLVIAEQAFLAGVRIERGDADAWPFCAESPEHVVGQVDLGQDLRRR